MSETVSQDLIADRIPPRSEREEFPRMEPSVALERMRAGQKIERVRICRLKFEGEFPKQIELVNVVLERPEFRESTFHAPVVFVRCEFLGLSTPRGPVLFEQSLAFKSCTLKRMRFDLIEVRGAFTLDNSEIHGPFKVVGCKLGTTKAWETRCHGWVEFSNCTIARTADFRSCHIDEGLVLNGTRFEGDLIARGMTCCKKLELTDSTCEGLVDLSKAKLHDYVYLEAMIAGPNCRFAFLNAVADRIQVRPEQLQGRLLSEHEGRFSDARHEYGLLKASYQVQHRFDDEDWALHQFKINQRKAKPRSWKKPWTKLAQLCDRVFLDWGCGYGTRPNRAVLTALTLMFFFAMIYSVGISHFEIDAPPLDDLPRDHWANRILFGLLMTVSVFTSGFGGGQLHGAHGWVLIPLAVEAVLGTLLWGLFVVAFSRKVIR